MKKLYNTIKNNKLITASIATIATGAIISFNGAFNLSAYSVPEPTRNNINAYVKTLDELEDTYNHNVKVRELLSPSFRDSLEITIAELEAKKDSLESLPTFEEDKKEYENEISESYGKFKKENNYTMGEILAGIGIMCSSLLFLGIDNKFKKKKRAKERAENVK